MRRLRTQRGTLLTKGKIDKLAAEAERGYDLSKGIRERVTGRPALGGGKGTSPRIAFRAQPEVFQAAQARARAEGRSVSDLARDAMEEYLATRRRGKRTTDSAVPRRTAAHAEPVVAA